MKKVLIGLLAIGTACSVATAADARDGCGRGFHRGPYGHCRPNGEGFVGPGVGPALVIGNLYPGRGYWDGHRYWERRERGGDGWHYHH